jgi:hypothetical protein
MSAADFWERAESRSAAPFFPFPTDHSCWRRQRRRDECATMQMQKQRRVEGQQRESNANVCPHAKSNATETSTRSEPRAHEASSPLKHNTSCSWLVSWLTVEPARACSKRLNGRRSHGARKSARQTRQTVSALGAVGSNGESSADRAPQCPLACSLSVYLMRVTVCCVRAALAPSSFCSARARRQASAFSALARNSSFAPAFVGVGLSNPVRYPKRSTDGEATSWVRSGWRRWRWWDCSQPLRCLRARQSSDPRPARPDEGHAHLHRVVSHDRQAQSR